MPHSRKRSPILVIGPSIAYIPLTGHRYSLIDSFSAAMSMDVLWRANFRLGTNYAYHTSKGSYIFLHRIVSGVSEDLEVDHINGDAFDNRLCNLRPCTRAQNEANKKCKANTATGYKGVWRQKRRFATAIRVNKKNIYLGHYLTVEDAARAYDAAAREHYGQFARYNFPEENERPAR